MVFTFLGWLLGCEFCWHDYELKAERRQRELDLISSMAMRCIVVGFR